MTKAIVVPDPVQLYVSGDTWIPWQLTPTIEVGTVSALRSAIQNANAGDVISILPGTYNMQDTLVAAAPNVTVMGASGVRGDVILRGRGMDNANYGNCPHGFYCQYAGLTLKDLTLEQYYFHGLTFGAGAGNAVVDNVDMLDMGQQFIKASAFPNAINNGLINNVRFAYTNGRPTTNHDGAGYFYGGFIDVHNGANWIIRDSFFDEMAPTEAEIAAINASDPLAIQYWWSPAIYFWNRSSNTLIERNIFKNNPRAVALGLTQRTDGTFDHTGGIVRNNMIVLTPNRLGAAQIADADAQILAWQSPGAKIYHNTILTNGQMSEAVRVRFESTGVEVRNNLADDTVRSMDGAIVDSGNILNAQSSWFVNPSTGNLRLSSAGAVAVSKQARLTEVLVDIDSASRLSPTYVGADEYSATTGGGSDVLITLNPDNNGNPSFEYLSMMDKYLGGFRVPASPGGSGNGVTGWSSGVIAHNPTNNSLFVAGMRGDVNICEVAIPTTLGSATDFEDMDQLPIASVIQQLANANRGTGADGALELAGAYCNGTSLVLTSFGPYAQDSSGRSVFQVYRDADDLAGTVVDGYIDTPYWFGAGGWISRVPTEKVADFGGTHLTGFSNSGGNRSSTKSLSNGPAAYATNVDDMISNSSTLTGNVFPQEELVAYYLDDLHDDFELVPQNQLYNWDDSTNTTQGNSLWTALSECSYGMLIPGTRTYIVFGSQSMHTNGGWYGNNDNNLPAGIPPHPSFIYQGPHPRDPYDVDFWYWLYREEDIIDVARGERDPWQITPYEWGKLNIPMDTLTYAGKFIGSGTFDETNSILYLTLREWDNTQGMPCPLVLAFDFSV